MKTQATSAQHVNHIARRKAAWDAMAYLILIYLTRLAQETARRRSAAGR